MHLALYRKYRSATFDEVISQEHITTTLKNQIKSGTPAHAYLFTGSISSAKQVIPSNIDIAAAVTAEVNFFIISIIPFFFL